MDKPQKMRIEEREIKTKNTKVYNMQQECNPNPQTASCPSQILLGMFYTPAHLAKPCNASMLSALARRLRKRILAVTLDDLRARVGELELGVSALGVTRRGREVDVK